MATKRTVQPDNDKLDAQTLAMLKTKVLRSNYLQAQIDALKDEYDTLNADILNILESQPVQIDRVEFDGVRASVVRRSTLNTDGWAENYPGLWRRLVKFGAEYRDAHKDELAIKYATLKETLDRAKTEDKESTGMITKAIEESTEVKTTLKITRK